MRIALGALLLLAATEAGAESLLHVSGIARPPVRALIQEGSRTAPVEIEVRDGHLGLPIRVAAGEECSLTLLGDDGVPMLSPLRFIVPPEGGRHALIVSPGLPSGARLNLVPVDFTSQPVGSTRFLNLSENVVRCWLGSQFVEVAPGRSVLHPLEGRSRRKVNHRVEYLDRQGKWIHDSSTTLILAAEQRFIFTLGPGKAEDGPLLRHNVTDHSPETNALPETKVSPVAPKPPEGQPAR
ncbi:MAG: hypothetical protein ACKO4N_08285 [Verrucomicrobiota bacterium]